MSSMQAEKLLEQKGKGNDALLVLTWNRLGDYYADRQNWHKVCACPTLC